MMHEFVLPKGVTGFNIDDTPAAASNRTGTFVSWCRALGDVLQSRTVHEAASAGNFDAVSFESHELWLLQNRHMSLAGAVAKSPSPGFAYAVEGEFIDVGIALPPHLATWGPTLLSAATLNRELAVDDWVEFSPPARDHADQYKPTRIGQVVFNYWDQKPASRP